MNGTDGLCGLCKAKPAGDILERPAGEVAEEGDHGGKDRQCEKCVQCHGKAAHALAAASCVITLERFNRLVRQLGRAGADELALIICHLSMRRMGQYIAAKRKDGLAAVLDSFFVSIQEDLVRLNLFTKRFIHTGRCQ